MPMNDRRRKAVSGKNKGFYDAQARRATFIATYKETHNLDVACAAADIVRSTYSKWRLRFPDFAAAIDAERVSNVEVLGDTWDGSFADFRKRYFGMDSPWFHLRMIRALEHGKPGSVTLILVPPEHGKTSLLEDYASYKLAVEPDFRITYASEKIDHAEKVLGLVMNRMETEGPYREYAERFGPFTPPSEGSGRKTRQTWSKKKFSVFRKRSSDERDYSMVALGIGAAVAGTRTDLLVLDDVQSLTNLNQAAAILRTIRQDWLTRPGSKGRTVIIGTRVGEGDVYELMIEAGIIDELIEIPAYTGEEWVEPQKRPGIKPKDDPQNLPPEGCKLLWPERYSRQEYLAMRWNAGEDAWLRNYMQRPRGAGNTHFTLPVLAECFDPMRTIFLDPPHEVREIVVGLDPGYGTNATMAAGMTADKLYPLAWKLDYDLGTTEEILAQAGIFAEQYQLGAGVGGRPQPCHVSDLIVEDKAFQKGLFEDQAMKSLVKTYGFVVTGHQTGGEKADPNFGIPGMARSFRRQEIVLPAADDPATKAALEQLTRELTSWKLYARGNRLKQDLVMALWFCWLRWQARRATLQQGHTQTIQTAGLPFKPMGSLFKVGV